MRNDMSRLTSWRRRKWPAITGLFCLCFLLGVITLGMHGYLRAETPRTVTTQPITLTTPQPTFAHLVARTMPAVVNISTTQKGEWRQYSPFPTPGPFGRNNPFEDFLRRFYGDRPPMGERRSLGSGFLISADGYIVTNHHVISGATKISVHLTKGDTREYQARIIGTDEKTDLALIKIDAQQPLPTLPLGSSEALNVGDWVMAIGNPFGFDQSVTLGIVSAKERVLGAGPYDDFIQTDASINPGNSGGPLLNMQGEVVGVNTAIFSQTGGNVGIGFAIPMDLAKTIVAQLRESGTVARAWLGVGIQAVTPELARAFGLPEPRGALISDVVPKSPAQKGGLQKGDIIIKVGAVAIASVRELPTVVAQQPIGEQATITALRDGKEKTFRVTLEKMADAQVALTKSDESNQQWGMTVADLHSDRARRFRPETDRPGVAVVAVEPGSPAADAGVQPGDVIEEVNRTPVASVQSFIEEVGKVKESDRLLLLLRRGQYATFLVLRKET